MVLHAEHHGQLSETPSRSQLGSERDGPRWQPAHTEGRNAGRGQCARSPGEGNVMIAGSGQPGRMRGRLGHSRQGLR
jgi:hypothetical protein